MQAHMATVMAVAMIATTIHSMLLPPIVAQDVPQQEHERDANHRDDRERYDSAESYRLHLTTSNLYPSVSSTYPASSNLGEDSPRNHA